MTASLIRAVEEANSAESLVAAVRALAMAGKEEAIPTLIQVLGYNNPGAAVAAVDGLVGLGATAVSYLMAQIDGYNYGARAWAIRACALIGDARTLDLLIDAAKTDFSLSVRRASAKGLGIIKWSQFEPLELETAQTKTLNTLIEVSIDPEWVVRYAAIASLEFLSNDNPSLTSVIKPHLAQIMANDEEIANRARAKKALIAMDN